MFRWWGVPDGGVARSVFHQWSSCLSSLRKLVGRQYYHYVLSVRRVSGSGRAIPQSSALSPGVLSSRFQNFVLRSSPGSITRAIKSSRPRIDINFSSTTRHWRCHHKSCSLIWCYNKGYKARPPSHRHQFILSDTFTHSQFTGKVYW